MALSTNQNQLRKHGPAAPIPPDLPEAERSIALWGWVNLAAARYGEEHLGPRYLRIRFEDLCASPVEIASEILRFLELPGDPARALDASSPQAHSAAGAASRPRRSLRSKRTAHTRSSSSATSCPGRSARRTVGCNGDGRRERSRLGHVRVARRRRGVVQKAGAAPMLSGTG